MKFELKVFELLVSLNDVSLVGDTATGWLYDNDLLVNDNFSVVESPKLLGDDTVVDVIVVDESNEFAVDDNPSSECETVSVARDGIGIPISIVVEFVNDEFFESGTKSS